MDYIRRTYRVPAKRGMRVLYTAYGALRYGTITGSSTGPSGAYIMVKLDDSRISRPFHPTWEMRYLA